MRKHLVLFLLGAFLLTGAVEAQTLRNASNAQIGKVESDGVVRNASNARIGKIDKEGIVRDDSNKQIGSAKGVDKKIAAVIFFFKLLE